MGKYATFNMFGTLTLTSKIRAFCLLMQRTRLTKLIKFGMLWTVFHLWPYGDRFVFNCYCHRSLPALRNWYGTSNTLYGREFVRHGDPMDMVAYGVGVLPLIKCVKLSYPDIPQPCYAEDYGALYMFNNLE